MSIDDDRTAVGQTVKLILTPCVAGLRIFFLTSEYTVLCEGSSELNRKKIDLLWSVQIVALRIRLIRVRPCIIQ